MPVLLIWTLSTVWAAEVGLSLGPEHQSLGVIDEAWGVRAGVDVRLKPWLEIGVNGALNLDKSTHIESRYGPFFPVEAYCYAWIEVARSRAVGVVRLRTPVDEGDGWLPGVAMELGAGAVHLEPQSVAAWYGCDGIVDIETVSPLAVVALVGELRRGDVSLRFRAQQGYFRAKASVPPDRFKITGWPTWYGLEVVYWL